MSCCSGVWRWLRLLAVPLPPPVVVVAVVSLLLLLVLLLLLLLLLLPLLRLLLLLLCVVLLAPAKGPHPCTGAVLLDSFGSLVWTRWLASSVTGVVGLGRPPGAEVQG